MFKLKHKLEIRKRIKPKYCINNEKELQNHAKTKFFTSLCYRQKSKKFSPYLQIFSINTIKFNL